MSKLSAENQFLDLSDYGRSFGRFLAKSLQKTKYTPIHVTFLFGFCGLLSIVSMLSGYYILAGFLLLLKSGIDAADGELARLKKTPSYIGRYLDSIFDILLNFMFLGTIAYITNSHFSLLIAAFFGLQLQGTLYNYYYVILRNNTLGGDATSKVFEINAPKALPGETQRAVNNIFKMYLSLYGVYDRIIYFLDASAYKVKRFPNWFMTILSVYGLGFQLLIMAVFLAMNLIHYILPFFIAMTFPILILVLIRKKMIK
ncbi:CDP-alcohol phosphatidyltransferase family protein [Flavobacterium tegetincola]|uniref:CDP-alcohol phosphatidyltransferase family protein n=1 Tax=Flavobacterium tegetincola TaxID=150172 RepID=UPI0004012971|nr:CDP-alcohol phosphatidyltransferase family protein [Flavobacterium tegetincola]